MDLATSAAGFPTVDTTMHRTDGVFNCAPPLLLRAPVALDLDDIVGWHMFEDAADDADYDYEADADYDYDHAADDAYDEDGDYAIVDGDDGDYAPEPKPAKWTCTVRGCTNRVAARKMCARHCGYHTKKQLGRCNVHGCTNRVAARKMCARHCGYIDARVPCRMRGCTNAQFKNRLCARHTREACAV